MELLFRVKDKRNPITLADAFYLDARLLQRGDIVCLMPDGHPWSDIEKSNPDWRIFSVSTLDQAEGDTMLTPELSSTASQVLQRRGFQLNLDGPVPPPNLIAWLADDSRTQPIFSISIGLFRALKIARPVLNDPAVIT